MTPSLDRKRLSLKRRARLLPAKLALIAAALCLVGCGGEEKTRCSVEEQESGEKILRCSDGSELGLGWHHPATPLATLQGRVERFGESLHEGIEVLLTDNLGTPMRRTESAADGSFSFDDLPAGFYHLRFHSPGYLEEVLSQQLLLPEGRALETVVLRSGRRLHGGTCARMVVAPREDAFLCLRHGEGELLLWEEEGGLQVIAQQAGLPAFSPDGGLILFLDDYDGDGLSGTLSIYDRTDASTLRVAEHAQSWQIAPGGGSIAVRQTGGRLALWTWRLRSTVIAERSGGSRFSPDGSLLLALAQDRDEAAQLVLWDVVAEAGTSLGPALAPLPSFASDGRSFVFRSNLRESHLWDGRLARTLPLGKDLRKAQLSPKGEALLLHGRDGELWLLPSGSGPRQLLAEAVEWADFDPKGGSLFYRSSEGSLLRWDLQAQHTESLFSAPALESPLLSPAGGSLAFRARESEGGPWTLWVWSEKAGLQEVAANLRGKPSFSPDGQVLTFLSGPASELHWWEVATGDVRLLGAEIPLEAPLLWQGGSRRLLFLDGPSPLPGLAPLALWDGASQQRIELGDDLAPRSCQFTREGSLLCLARPSLHEGPRGAELLRWDAGSAALHSLGDGVLSFSPTRSGKRTLSLHQGELHTERDLLWLHDSALERSIPLDDHVSAAVAGGKWVAYTVSAPIERRGLYLSTYPEAPEEEGDEG